MSNVSVLHLVLYTGYITVSIVCLCSFCFALSVDGKKIFFKSPLALKLFFVAVVVVF